MAKSQKATTTETTETRKQAYIEKRNKLREVSNSVKPLVEKGLFTNVNEAIIDIYKQEHGFTELKTFHQWKDEGKSVKKGSKAFVVWGKPQKIEHPDPGSEDDELEYFPLCYLFSDKQVTERSKS